MILKKEKQDIKDITSVCVGLKKVSLGLKIGNGSKPMLGSYKKK